MQCGNTAHSRSDQPGIVTAENAILTETNLAGKV
jgi:hypothetical protein